MSQIKVTDEVWIATALLPLHAQPRRVSTSLITNDARLKSKHVEGIRFVVSLEHAPI